MSSFSIKSFLQITLLLLFSAIFIHAQTPTPTPEEETEKIFTEEIKLNVFATDINGKFVSDVKKEDLVITEDGRIHQASSIKRVPANILIVLDTGGEMRQVKGFKQTVDTAANLIDSLQPEDSVAIMQYNDKVDIVAEWTNKEQALTLLKSKANFGRRSVFLDALETATKFLQKSSLDNRHLVLITDGTDSFNKLSEREAVMKNLLSTDVNVHVISYTTLERTDIEPRTKGVSTSPPKAMPDEIAAQMPPGIIAMNRGSRIMTINTDRAFSRKMRERKQDLIDSEKFLMTLAENTNGEVFLPESKKEMLEETPVRVANIIDSSYVITYTPKRALAESEEGEIRDIQVTSRRPNLTVQAHRKLIIKN